MTLVQLQYIVALDIYRSFVAAADACHVSQPALTTQIKRLESQLGVILFDRSKKPVIPTEIGAKIVEQARFVLQESQKVRDIISEFESEMSGEVRLGIIPTVAPYLLPLFINDFNASYPQVSLSINEDKTESIIQDLRNGDLDAGIIATPVNVNGIKAFPLFYERLYAYVSEGHRLKDQATVCALTINPEELLLLKEGNCFRNQVINICQEKQNAGAYSQFFYQSNSIESLKRIVDSRDALTVIPELATLVLPQEKQGRVKPFSDCSPVREISLVVSRSFLKKRLLENLMSSIQQSIPEKMKHLGEGQLIHTELKL
ncbi:MAG: LysR substrate-binding domain-containing protein [Bacteroidota bacterium]